MNRPILLLAALALAIPVSPAVAKQPPPGRTIVVAVRGVPTSAKATIVLKGPTHKTIKTRRTRTVRHLKPGTYRIVPRKLTTAAGTWTGRARPAKGKVGTRKGLRVTVTYAKRTTQPPLQPPVDEPEPPELPPTPYPDALAPSSIVLVSKTAEGAPGDKPSTDPAWSPDGQDVAFSSCAGNLGGTPDNYCYVYKAHVADGEVARIAGTRMTDINDWGGDPSWSPDGTRLVFTTMAKLMPGDTDTNQDVYTVSATGTDPQRVSQTQTGAGMQNATVARAEDPQWSPDGSRIMFRATATNLAAGTGDIHLKTLADGSVVRTGAGGRSEGARWSADGRIAFTAGSETFNPVTYNYDRSYDVYTATGTGATVTAATTDHGVFGAPSWSPTGSIAFSTSSAVSPSDTNEARDIYTTDGVRVSTAPGGAQSLWDATDPVWSPDGQKVAYVADSDGPSTIVVKSVVTGTVTQLADPTNGRYCVKYEYDEESGETYCGQGGAYIARDPAWSPDSTRIAFTSTYPTLVPGDTNNTSDVFIATL